MNKKHIPIGELEVYRLARELSKLGWEIYNELSWQDKKIMGDQFITATDSFGANIVEGYRRYHYLDKIKFFYNARASLAEASDHWLELLKERKKVKENYYKKFKDLSEQSSKKLQNFINSVYKTRNIPVS
jgi:four helix bundle protein